MSRMAESAVWEPGEESERLPGCFRQAHCPDADEWEKCRNERPDVYRRCIAARVDGDVAGDEGEGEEKAEKARAAAVGRCVRFGEYDPALKCCKTCTRFERPACIVETRRRFEEAARRDAEKRRAEAEARARERARRPEVQRRYAEMLAKVDEAARRHFGRGLDRLRLAERLQLPPYCQATGHGVMCDDCPMDVCCRKKGENKNE